MRVLVVGLAATGAAVVRFAAGRGDEVQVLEDRPASTDAFRARRSAVLAAGATLHEEPSAARATALAQSADLVVPSPGVPERHPAIQGALGAGIAVRSEVDLAAEVAAAPAGDGGSRAVLLAVTGTNGKTTVTTLVARMLAASGRPSVAAGNIGTPLLDAVQHPEAVPGYAAGPGTPIVVAETSSFQLRFTTCFRPRVAALLNLADDHLDWHGSFAAYADAKARIFEHQGPEDLLVYNADDPEVVRRAQRAPGRHLAFSLVDRGAGLAVAPVGGVPCLVGPDGEVVVEVGALARRAPHDLANALAAAGMALESGADPEAVRDVLVSFTGLAHHVEAAGTHAGVRYFDDSKATNVHAVLAAVEGLAAAGVDRIVLIAGGRNKGLDLAALRVLAPRLRAVVAIGEAAPEVRAALGPVVAVEAVGSMRAAVEAAAASAQRGDAVLLSPACASFDWYTGYAERGDDFAIEVARLGKWHGQQSETDR